MPASGRALRLGMSICVRITAEVPSSKALFSCGAPRWKCLDGQTCEGDVAENEQLNLVKVWKEDLKHCLRL